MTTTNLRSTTAITCLLLAVSAIHAAGQQTMQAASQPHPIEMGASYTYLRTNILPGCDCFSMNGGDLQITFGLRPGFQLVGEAGVAHRGGLTPDGYAITQVDYTLGLRYFPFTRARVQPFAETLFGGAYALGSLAPGNNSIGGSSNAVAFVAGGGVAFRLNKHLVLQPARIDYEFTNFHNGQANRQNDLRLSTGVLYRFGAVNP
jgi:peptidoglycan-associated lipoprotein